ncbi:MAG: hypothetical protein ACFBZ8_07250 [Opitutales bacterium]
MLFLAGCQSAPRNALNKHEPFYGTFEGNLTLVERVDQGGGNTFFLALENTVCNKISERTLAAVLQNGWPVLTAYEDPQSRQSLAALRGLQGLKFQSGSPAVVEGFLILGALNDASGEKYLRPGTDVFFKEPLIIVQRIEVDGQAIEFDYVPRQTGLAAVTR